MTVESELIYPTLSVLAEAPRGELATTELREVLKDVLPLTPDDLAPLTGRSDTKIDQTIRNMKSHKKTAGNIIYEGYVEEVPRGFRITERGKSLLARKPKGLFD